MAAIQALAPISDIVDQIKHYQVSPSNLDRHIRTRVYVMHLFLCFASQAGTEALYALIKLPFAATHISNLCRCLGILFNCIPAFFNPNRAEASLQHYLESTLKPVNRVRSYRVVKNILVNTALCGILVVAAGALATLKNTRHSDWLYSQGGTSNCTHLEGFWYRKEKALCEAALHRVLSVSENTFRYLEMCSREYKAWLSVGVIVVPAVCKEYQA